MFYYNSVVFFFVLYGHRPIHIYAHNYIIMHCTYIIIILYTAIIMTVQCIVNIFMNTEVLFDTVVENLFIFPSLYIVFVYLRVYVYIYDDLFYCT